MTHSSTVPAPEELLAKRHRLAEEPATLDHLLREVWQQFHAARPRYSQRALARDLAVSSSYLSKVFRGEKAPSHRMLLTLLGKLDIQEKEKFLHSAIYHSLPDSATKKLYLHQDQIPPFKEVEKIFFGVLSSWLNLAILDLSTCMNFQSNAKWIAERLGATPEEVSQSLGQLFFLGFLVNKQGQWTKAERRLKFTAPESTEIRKYHQQALQKGLEELETNDRSRRYITGMTLAVNPKKLPQAREMLRHWLKESWDVLSEGECTEVYQLNFQLFPLTKEAK